MADSEVASREGYSTPLAIRYSLFALLSGDARADRAAHAGAAVAAIAVRILGQILLMIILGEEERRGIADFRRDRAHVLGFERFGIGGFRRLGGGALRRREHINAGAVLGADVAALAHALGRIVVLPKRLEQALVGNLFWIVDHEHDFVVAGAAGADFLVGRVRRQTAGIADRGDVDAVAELPETALRSPKTAQPEHRRF